MLKGYFQTKTWSKFVKHTHAQFEAEKHAGSGYQTKQNTVQWLSIANIPLEKCTNGQSKTVLLHNQNLVIIVVF